MTVAYKDYYKILGVDKNADARTIKQAYRRLARKHHPDVRPGDKTGAERFKEVNEAYEVLSDPEKRRRYDELGADWTRYAGGVKGGPGGGRDFDGFRVHVGHGADFGGFSEFFRTFFGDLGIRRGPFAAEDIETELFGGRGPLGREARGPRRTRRGEDFESPVEISLEEAVSGATRTVEFDTLEPCTGCAGSGRRGQARCATCGGRGEVTRGRRLEVKIPPGVRDGSRVRAAGEGGAGSAGGPRGDLYLRIHVRPHPIFERRDDDLYVDLPVSVWEAALGTEVEVPSLRGKVTMKVPPEAPSGQTFRLPGYGVPHVKGGGRGDQFVRIRIVPPKGLTARERALFEELRQLRPRPPRE